ncbi:MAG: 6-hydroxymethylpterin diphosphokinase MptE-like protein, partial [Oscillospiraceae bacterium]
MSLIDSIKDITVLKRIRYAIDKRKWKKLNDEIEQSAESRENGSKDDRYIKLYNVKDKHKGQRCFIVATGPSLTLSDLDMLKGEITFGMNSICRIYDKTEWRPTYYGIQDIFVYPKMKDVIEKYYHNAENVFVSDELSDMYGLSSSYITYPFNSAYHLYDQHFNKFYSKFSGNAYARVYDGYSITYSLLQIAVYMGFSEIYLLGADCSYKKGEKNHFVESGHHDRLEYLNHDKMITGYKAAKEYADANNIKIINC